MVIGPFAGLINTAIFLNGSVFANYSQGNVAVIVPLSIPDDFVGMSVYSIAISSFFLLIKSSANFDYTLASGALLSGSVIDDDGDDYGEYIECPYNSTYIDILTCSSINITSAGQQASASIDVGEDGVGNVMILGWADNTQVSLSVSTAWVTSATSISTAIATGTTSPASSPSKSSGAQRVRVVDNVRPFHAGLLILMAWLLN